MEHTKFKRKEIQSEEMIILGTYKFVLKSVGLYPHGGRENIIARAIFSLLFLLSNLSILIFFTLNLSADVDRVLTVMPQFFGLESIMSSYFHLLINREQFYSLSYEMENIVFESE